MTPSFDTQISMESKMSSNSIKVIQKTKTINFILFKGWVHI